MTDREISPIDFDGASRQDLMTCILAGAKAIEGQDQKLKALTQLAHALVKIGKGLENRVHGLLRAQATSAVGMNAAHGLDFLTHHDARESYLKIVRDALNEQIAIGHDPIEWPDLTAFPLSSSEPARSEA
jgi:hypothetical protein